LAQFFFGPLLLFTLPAVGLSDHLYRIILSEAALGQVVLLILRHQIKQPTLQLRKSYVIICLLFSIVVLAMGTGRHLYRETALEAHRSLIKERTAAYQAALDDFRQKLASGVIILPVNSERVFRNCASCHAMDKPLAGQSLLEIASKDNLDGIVNGPWLRKKTCGIPKNALLFPPSPGSTGDGGRLDAHDGCAQTLKITSSGTCKSE
jgi:cytochrome c